ncbi:MAG: phosphate ABC transporter permease subunit PstC [Candidatus Cloacimonetes bacterium]|nr:phosphate ABC transporter permease subunit PstC [Candidatus Cloacimonadota bacterium]
MEIQGEEPEPVTFALWDKSENKIVTVAYTTYSNPGQVIGYAPGKPLFLQAFSRIGNFIGTSIWHPTQEPGKFGILALIIGSLLATLGALIIAIPFGIGSAIYISEIARPRVREIVKPVIELLAGIPSVVYGLFGMAFLSPALMKWFHIDTGLNVFNAAIILGIMVIPIISSMSEDALSSVPKSLRQASYGLGANRWETITRVVLPAAKTGVIGSILLGFGRAIGETMVVIMVAGGSPQIPSSIFQPVRPMTAAIASEMGETAHGTLHFHALFGIAVVLFLITFITNLISEFAFYKQKKY